VGSGPVALGLVGCGAIGQVHAAGLQELAEEGLCRPVVAADPDARARSALSRNCQFERWASEPLEVVLDPQVEAVMIASPTWTHPQLVSACLQARKPVFCEKPLATSFADVVELVREAEASGVVAQVGFHNRFHPLLNHLRSLVGSGAHGRPMAYSVRDDQFWPTGSVVPGHSSWRSSRHQAGGGALLEHSIHSADLLGWIFGPVRRVFGFSRNVFGFDVEDAACVSIEHDSGVIGSLTTVFNSVQGREERRFEVFFEKAAVEVTTDFLVGAREDSFSVQEPGSPPASLDVAELRQRFFDSIGLRGRSFAFYTYTSDRSFLEAVAAGSQASPNFGDGLAAHALVEASYRSMRSGQPVVLEELGQR
jgi:UDP-N-acetyl-2-amino-2-deoxyglucuronate dehydrogenase